MQLQEGQHGGQAGESSARELQLEEQLAEARSIIDEQVQQRTVSEINLLNSLLWFPSYLSPFTFCAIVSEIFLHLRYPRPLS